MSFDICLRYRFVAIHIRIVSWAGRCLSSNHGDNCTYEADKWDGDNAQNAPRRQGPDLILETIHWRTCSCHSIHLPLQWYID